MFNFQIKEQGLLSLHLLAKGITDFQSAATWTAALPYRRNKEKSSLLCLLEDHGGTCSTKHAFLRKLSLEQGYPEVKLILGIFKMDAEYDPKIAQTLAKNQLTYLPEAHNYLQIQDQFVDFTTTKANYLSFKKKLLHVQEIEYHQINEEKIAIHQTFLQQWLKEQKPGWSLAQIWKIREQCILDLQEE